VEFTDSAFRCEPTYDFARHSLINSLTRHVLQNLTKVSLQGGSVAINAEAVVHRGCRASSSIPSAPLVRSKPGRSDRKRCRKWDWFGGRNWQPKAPESDDAEGDSYGFGEDGPGTGRSGWGAHFLDEIHATANSARRP